MCKSHPAPRVYVPRTNQAPRITGVPKDYAPQHGTHTSDEWLVPRAWKFGNGRPSYESYQFSGRQPDATKERSLRAVPTSTMHVWQAGYQFPSASPSSGPLPDVCTAETARTLISSEAARPGRVAKEVRSTSSSTPCMGTMTVRSETCDAPA